MELKKIKEHWKNMATQHSTDLKATSKTTTLKKIEIDAIAKAIRSIVDLNPVYKILEVGCGNGKNIFSLADAFPNIHFTGIDYVTQMIDSAKKTQNEQKSTNTTFHTGDILKLDKNKSVDDYYDLVFTDRCLINLNTIELQLEALKQLTNKVRKGCWLMIVENSTITYSNQNRLRKAIGLKERVPDKYNLFIDEKKFIDYAQKELNLNLLDTEDFISLHDIILYVLLPKINNGMIDYTHPIMEAVTELLTNLGSEYKNSFGHFGQNRLYLFRK